MMKNISITMIHDTVCSWCPIGYSNLKQALYNSSIEAQIHFLPSELNPNMPIEGEEIAQHLMRRNAWNEKALHQYRRQLLASAEKAKVKIDFNKRKFYYNTDLSHRLLHIAETFGKQQIVNEKLIAAYFEQGLNIGLKSVLLKLAEQSGLDIRYTEKALESPTTIQALNDKKAKVKALNISSIPAFIFNDSVLVSGSNTVQFFEKTITEIASNTPIKANA